MRLFDAHTHLSPNGTLCHADGLDQLAVASTVAEYHRLEALAQRDPGLHIACGVHPWRSDSVKLEALLPFVERCVAIGEIGMDAVWCQVDLMVQQAVFREQLAWAEQLQKPVILHTKGCERAVLSEMEAFSQPILVHWYSAPHDLAGYLEKDCYFTVGPDLDTNPAVRAVAEQAPPERLLVESDGIGGLSWALGRPIADAEVPACLVRTLQSIAALRGLPLPQLAAQVIQNAARFLGRE